MGHVKKPAKTEKPLVALFLAQPNGTLVGQDKPFDNHWDLCTWAANECGYQGVTVPACLPFVDVDRVLNSDSYADDLHGKYEKCGVKLRRLEMHTDGQLTCLHPTDLARYRMFDKSTPVGSTFRDYERAAEARSLKTVGASAKLGFTHLVNFSGNRGWTAGRYPWSAFPKQWRLYILLLLLFKHLSIFRKCAELEVVEGFEIHPQEDINSPLLLFLLRELAKIVAPEVVPFIGANADASHPELAGDNAALHFAFLWKHGLLRMCHLKDAELGGSFLDATTPYNPANPDSPIDSLVFEGGSIGGDFASVWSKSTRRFCTFGTGNADWNKIIPILLAVHQQQKEGLDFVVEGECSRFSDMMQALKIGAENARRAIAGEPLLEVQEIAPKASQGDNWEQFCTSDVPATKLLCMDRAETRAIEAMREKIPAALLRFF